MFSLLIFSRNDTKNAIELAGSMKDIANQVVIIDSSDKVEHDKLKEKAKKNKLDIYFTVPFGYADLLRNYGISKCKNDWILYLDTDERLNEEFLKEINNIIKNAKCDGFAIKRYEEATPSSHTNFFTWQTRLFRKSRTTFTGIIHEQAKVDGTLCQMPNKYYIAHRTDLMHHSSNSYGKMSVFETLSYTEFNNIINDYLCKFFAFNDKSTKGRFILSISSTLLTIYEKLLFKRKDLEISKGDYLRFYFLRTIGYSIRQHNISYIFRIWRDQKNYLNYLENERKKIIDEYKITRENLFEVSKILYKEGVIRYLGFDNPKRINELTKNYNLNQKEKGIDFTIKLIIEKYKKLKRK